MPTNKDQPPPYSEVHPPQAGFIPQYTGAQPPVGGGQPHPQVYGVILTPLGPSTQRMQCPSCHANIATTTRIEPSTKTHIFALLLCILQCYIFCCLPYCIDSCQSTNHYCPNCGAFLGTYDP